MTKFSRGAALAILAGALAWTSPAPAAVSDAWITAKTKISLMTNEGLGNASAINVDTNEGVVTLHGKVATADAKQKAEDVAKGIEGVKSVKDLLQVVPKPQRDAVDKGDDIVKDDVKKAFDADPAVKDSGISVASVNKGVVLLSGSAKSLDAHLRAVKLARKVPGVHRVSSEVTVEGTN